MTRLYKFSDHQELQKEAKSKNQTYREFIIEQLRSRKSLEEIIKKVKFEQRSRIFINIGVAALSLFLYAPITSYIQMYKEISRSYPTNSLPKETPLVYEEKVLIKRKYRFGESPDLNFDS